MSNVTERLAAVIPGVYYDVIARVLPGLAVIIGVLWRVEYRFGSLKTDTGLEGGTLAWAAIAAGYVVGILLTNVSACIGRM